MVLPRSLVRLGGVALAIALAAWLSVALLRQGDHLPWVWRGPNGVLAVAGPLAVVAVSSWWWHRHLTSLVPSLLMVRGLLALVVSTSSLYASPRWSDGWGGHGVWYVVAGLTVPLTLPVSAWLLLAWPAGRLTNVERRVVVVIAGLAVSTGWGLLVLQERVNGIGGPNPIQVASLPALENALRAAFESVVRPVAVFAVLAVVARRERRRDPGARRLLRPGVTGLIVGLAALEIVSWFGFGYLLPWAMSDWIRFGLAIDEPTALGQALNLSDVNRVGLLVVAVGLGIGFRRLERAGGRGITESRTAVDVTEASELRGLVPLLGHNLGDPSAQARFRTPEGTWVDGDGNPIEGIGPGRALVSVAHGSEVIAAIELDDTLRAAPSLVEAAVAATGLLIEHQRLEALARIQLRELGRTRVALVAASDAAMLRLERDLHDGAQQRLVALAFEAGLLDRGGNSTDPEQRRPALTALRNGLEDARRDLLRVASGLAPALLAERGLAEALAAVVRSCPVSIIIEGEVDDVVPTEVLTAVWFVVNEAVTNAVKHAEASTIVVRLRADRAAVTVQVVDDGVGGADISRGTGLRGLRDRLTPLDGRLDISSGPGGGTRVDARVPLGATR